MFENCSNLKISSDYSFGTECRPLKIYRTEPALCCYDTYKITAIQLQSTFANEFEFVSHLQSASFANSWAWPTSGGLVLMQRQCFRGVFKTGIDWRTSVCQSVMQGRMRGHRCEQSHANQCC